MRRPLLMGFLAFLVLRIALSVLEQPTACRDGWRSSSIGSQGACSWHGGVGANWSAFLVTIISLVGGVVVFRAISAPLDREKAAKEAALVAEREQWSEQRKAAAKAEGTDCPKCGHPLQLRTAKRGRNSGSQFWGCSRYPSCKGTRPFSG